MATLTMGGRPASLHYVEPARLPLAVWCALAVLASLALSWLMSTGPLGQAFIDSDDATRLIEVRQLLGGASWYDLTLPRFGGSEPLVSHWSRLVDLPIAVLVRAFSVFLEPAAAETAARVVWPSLLLWAMLWLIAEFVSQRSDRGTAVAAVVLAVLCSSAMVQFAPGRIDHHNAMIVGAVGGALLMAAALEQPGWGWWAGALLGLGTAIGYEAILLTAATLGLAALMAVMGGFGRIGVRRAILAFALVVSVAFLLTVPPHAWRQVHCDALSSNVVVMSIAGAVGLAAILIQRPQPGPAMRLLALGAVGVTALAAAVSVAPACVKGPFAAVDAAVWPIWLANVNETQSILWLASTLPPLALAYIAHVTLATLAAIAIARRRGTPGTIYLALVMTVAALTSVWQAKLMPYAAMLAVVPLALYVGGLPGMAEVSRSAIRFAAVGVLNQKALLLLAALVVGTGSAASARFVEQTAAKRACLTSEAMAPLAALDPGLVVADIDLGPFIVAATRLNVLSAPYHRLDKQIIATDAVLYGDQRTARRLLLSQQATYVVTCEAMGPGNRPEPPAADALKPALVRGDSIPFLKPLPLAGRTPLKVWRVVSPRP